MYTELSNEAQFILGNLGHLKCRVTNCYGFVWKFTFDNGLGISIAKHKLSYGSEDDLFEIAVFEGDKLCYSTPITDDVVGWLTEEQVLDYARRIKALRKECVWVWKEPA